MRKMADAITAITFLLKELGIEVADASNYPTQHGYIPGNVLIFAGYLPGRACLFTVDVTYSKGRESSTSYIFSIRGQVKDKVRNIIPSIICQISRNAVSSEEFSSTTFHINTQSHAALDGFLFFRKFIRSVNVTQLERRFTRHISVWYVPEYSNEYVRRQKLYGEKDMRIFDYFNRKVLKKMPKGLFVANQMP